MDHKGVATFNGLPGVPAPGAPVKTYLFILPDSLFPLSDISCSPLSVAQSVARIVGKQGLERSGKRRRPKVLLARHPGIGRSTDPCRPGRPSVSASVPSLADQLVNEW